jgi:hypothetical protein
MVSTSLWRRHWLAGLGSAQSLASWWPISGTLAYIMPTIRKYFCPPCNRNWCRAWSCAWIRMPLPLSSASTLPSPVWCLLAPCRPPPATEAARAGPLTVVASKKCLGVTLGPATAQFFEPVGREGLCRQWRQPALGPPPQPSAVRDTRLASVELLCSRMLGLDLSAMGRGLGTTGYAAAQVWYHAEFEDNFSWSLGGPGAHATTHCRRPTSTP